MTRQLPGYHVANGLVTFGPNALALRKALDGQFLRWAAERDAPEWLFPPAVPVADLDIFSYFTNFPHLAMLATAIPERAHERYGQHGVDAGAVPSADLDPAALVLPPSACYQVYLHDRGARLAAVKRVTTVANCFRHEETLDGLRRLMSFTLREIVFIGTRSEVLAELDIARKKLLDFLRAIGLPVETRPAGDPFFDKNSGRFLTQRLFPTKEEFVYGDDLALASVNFHRNFFGERCDIRTEDGEIAFSGCIGFGIERLIQALVDEFGVDCAEVANRVGDVDLGAIT